MTNIPQISNMSFFNESSLDIEKLTSEIEKKINTKINPEIYELFCRNKFRKPLFDLYALFNPFNEATKAFYSFIPYLKKHLKKGDVILDVWNRTGWSTSMLSGLFPEQTIISLWEGDTDVLGYNGFSYWFANNESCSNVKIQFCNLKDPLPFENKSIALVFGFDILHRQLKTNLVNELVRISNDDGLIVFPHVHLSNAEPIPFFNRCGDLIHGKDYEKFFKKLNPYNKKGYVFSEPDLFHKSYKVKHEVKANPNTTDYNGLLAISNQNLDLEKELSYFNYFDYFSLKEGCLILNPIFEVDINNSVTIRTSSIETEIKNLLENHPVYNEKIKNTVGYSLSDTELIVLYWARKNRSCTFIQEQIKLDNRAFQILITKLQTLDVLQIFPLNSKHLRLQHYLAYQEFNESENKINLKHLWKRAVTSFPDNTYTLDRNDNTFYTYQEFDQIVKCITFTLIQKGLKKGDKIILHSDINFEAIGLFWACMNLGLLFIPINSSLPEKVFEDLVEKYDPKLIFLFTVASLQKKWESKTIFFDTENDCTFSNKLYFSEWLIETQETPILPEILENDLGAILHTSGSSGIPKGVKLTQGQLFQSAVNMVTAYLWNEKDNYLSIGNLDSMSGLRNACIVTAESGSSCIIPSYEEKNNTTNLLTCIYETDTTFLIASPSLLNQLLCKKDVKNRMAKVKFVLSTGSNLSTHLKELFFEKTDKKIHNYYGLTETTGFCIGESLNSNNFKGNFIGTPFDCIVQIVDENNNKVKVGEIGELRIYSYCISKGYYIIENSIIDPVQEWFYTGDLVKMDATGGIELIGRKTEFIKNSRSEIVYFKEIEDAILQISFINDMCIHSFFQDESEKMALFLEMNTHIPMGKNVVEEIKKTLTAKIGLSKIPSVIKIIEEIPRSKNGKLLKTELNQYL
jgi:acyl-coenzyme A synthetase/AMP-(fatty) acid ligase